MRLIFLIFLTSITSLALDIEELTPLVTEDVIPEDVPITFVLHTPDGLIEKHPGLSDLLIASRSEYFRYCYESLSKDDSDIEIKMEMPKKVYEQIIHFLKKEPMAELDAELLYQLVYQSTIYKIESLGDHLARQMHAFTKKNYWACPTKDRFKIFL